MPREWAQTMLENPKGTGDSSRRFNRLAGQKSPYLLQHSQNPVDWHPWGQEAFQKARAENRPIFLSIGYSTCHWCHVMEMESFENEEVAEILNANFIPVKVDREERPDIDRLHMTYVQATTGGGGWPMSVWLTPDLKPFYGGTYFPPEDKFGIPGFKSILLKISDAWKNNEARIRAVSEMFVGNSISIAVSRAASKESPDESLLDSCYRDLRASFDPVFGGFGGAPKFPRPCALNLIARYCSHVANLRDGGRLDAARGKIVEEGLGMHLLTLRKMAEGGIHDHIGGGFHRYSVDASWHIPHFEKMLYDQGQIASSYLDAYQITGDRIYADVARNIFEYVLRNMAGPEGQFYSAEDADSPAMADPSSRKEGAFYVWEMNEILELLDERESGIFFYLYGVQEDGNAENDPHGEFRNKNILHMKHSIAQAADKFNSSPEALSSLLHDARLKLFKAREKRPRPSLDDKTLTSWNGLMISAFARAYGILGDKEYLNAALGAAGFIREKLYAERNHRLGRCHRMGDSGIDGFSEDFAFLIQALLDLYEASFRPEFLDWAIELQNRQNDLFLDSENGGYFSTVENAGGVILRLKDDYDSAEPSANSISALNLERIALVTGNLEFSKLAEGVLRFFAEQIRQSPVSMPQMLSALSFQLGNPFKITIAGRQGAEDTDSMLRLIFSRFIPAKVVLLADPGLAGGVSCWEGVKNAKMIDGAATAYVCRGKVCLPPTNQLEELSQILDLGTLSFSQRPSAECSGR